MNNKGHSVIKLTNNVVTYCPICIWISILRGWLCCLGSWKISVSIFSRSRCIVTPWPICCCCGFSNWTCVSGCIIGTCRICCLILIFVLYICWWWWRVLWWLASTIYSWCIPRMSTSLWLICLWVRANRFLLVLFVGSTHKLFLSLRKMDYILLFIVNYSYL
jgi:hypothetical protein